MRFKSHITKARECVALLVFLLQCNVVHHIFLFIQSNALRFSSMSNDVLMMEILTCTKIKVCNEAGMTYGESLLMAGEMKSPSYVT